MNVSLSTPSFQAAPSSASVRASQLWSLFMWAALLVFVIGCMLRATYLDFADGDAGVLSDHFVNAVTAKNIASGHGWSASGWEFFPLSPHNLTTGPTVILPVALAIDVFGHGLIVPSVTVALLNCGLLLIVVLLAQRHFSDARKCALFVLGLLGLFSLFYPYYWSRVIGEITTILLLTAAALLLGKPANEASIQRVLMAAVCCGLACTSKELAALAVAGLGTAVAADALFIRRRLLKPTLLRFVLFAAVAATPLLLFRLYQHEVLASMDPQWVAGYTWYANRVHDYYSGMDMLRSMWSNPAHIVLLFHEGFTLSLHSAFNLFDHCWLGHGVVEMWLFIGILLAGCSAVVCRRAPLALFLFCMSLPLLAWFFMIAENALPRHMHIGASLLVVSLLVWLCELQKRYVQAGLMLVISVILLMSSTPSSRASAISFPHTLSAIGVAINQTSQHLKSTSEKPGVMGGVDANEFEYLADQPNALLSVQNEFTDAIEFDEGAYLARYPAAAREVALGHYKSGREYYLSPNTVKPHIAPVRIVGHPVFDVIYGPVPADWKPWFCTDTIYRNAFYGIARCSVTDLERYVHTLGGIDFRPVKWLRPQIVPPWTMREIF